MNIPNGRLGTVCGVCGRHKLLSDLIVCDVVRPSIAQALDTALPAWRKTGFICRTDLEKYRRHVVEDMIIKERGELTDLDREVIDSLASHETLTENTDETYEDAVTMGDRIADRMALFAGSWRFILSFLGLLVGWMVINSLAAGSFDPYPFILLNLLLSMVAAFQAPLIMMSQRRQEEKDRLRSQNDYQINLKAELEIRHLHEKMDHILIGQWQRLSRLREAQPDLFGEPPAPSENAR